MEILIHIKNPTLREFWRGPVDRLREIRNVCARETAELVANDGRKRVCGMWHVSMVTGGDDNESI